MKDVFIWDRDNLGTGKFNETGLRMHFINPKEQIGWRINPFCKTAHLRPQYVITIVEDRKRVPIVDRDPHPLIIDPMVVFGDCSTALGVGQPPVVTIYTAAIEAMPVAFRDAISVMLAHELGHAVSMWHCGDFGCYMRDPTVRLDDFTGIPYFPEYYCRRSLNQIRLKPHY